MRYRSQPIPLKTRFQLGLPKFIIGRLGPPVGSALTMEHQKKKNVLRKADPTAVTFWQTASLLHLSTAHAVNGFHQIEHSSVRAGPAHQVNAQSYHPRRVSHTAPQTSKSISYLSSV